MLQDTGNALAFSAASIWEVVIKRSLGRSDFAVDPFLLRRGLLDNDYDELPVTGDHVIALSRLPTLHKDPFDRILLAQCMVEGMVLLTSDGLVATYPRPEQKI
jgi:PIN domain nuclease of toxin-antitoxin system